MSRRPENGGEKEAGKIEIAMRDCINSDLERVGEEWRKGQHIEGTGYC